MVIRKDGTHRASGWTYHDQRDGAEQAGAVSIVSSRQSRAAILAAITATSRRHEHNRALDASGLNPDDWHSLFRAMIEAESAYNPAALSPKGAYGLGQLMPETARLLGVDRRNVAQNLDGAARYLLAQLSEFTNVDLALAAYNSGPHRVVEYGGVPPFSETRAYISRVNNIRTRLAGNQAPLAPKPPITAQIITAQNTSKATSQWPALALQLN
jgi:Transglycosylase SLT domain